MLLPDVNVLVYAFRQDAADHQHYRVWLDGTVNGNSSYACSDLVLRSRNEISYLIGGVMV